MECPVIYEPLRTLLVRLSKRIIVIGSVARGIRSGFGTEGRVWPKDIDFLWDMDSDATYETIKDNVSHLGLTFESVFPRCWTFSRYGWQVELLGMHYGPDYRAIRRRADRQTIGGIEFLVAKPDDTPVPPKHKSGCWVTWPT